MKEGYSFEQRFARGRSKYESPVGNINAVFVRPDNAKTDVPVVLAPGWSETEKVLKDCVSVLHDAGRPAIVLDHPRHGGVVDPQGNYPTEELRKALAILEIIQQDDIPQVDIIAHSEGAINGAIAASLEPERIRNMVLVSPAGLVGKDTIPRLIGRFALKSWKNAENIGNRDALGAFMRGQIEGAKNVAQNPSRAYQEVRAISRSEIGGMLHELHNLGIGIVIIHGVDDPGFPMSRLKGIVKSDFMPGGFVDGFLSVMGGHNELYIHPEEYTGAAEKMLTALEQKQVKKSPSA